MILQDLLGSEPDYTAIEKLKRTPPPSPHIPKGNGSGHFVRSATFLLVVSWLVFAAFLRPVLISQGAL